MLYRFTAQKQNLSMSFVQKTLLNNYTAYDSVGANQNVWVQIKRFLSDGLCDAEEANTWCRSLTCDLLQLGLGPVLQQDL